MSGADVASASWSPVARVSPAIPARLAPVCAAHVGQVEAVQELTSGNVSHVFRVSGTRGTVVLKARTDRFARIPHLETDPALIGLERRAIALLGSAVADVFPRILHYDPAVHAMVLTDIFPDRRTYEDHLLERPATVSEMRLLGDALRRVHRATRVMTAPLRADGDTEFRNLTFALCLEQHGHPVLGDLAARLRATADRQLILGDPAPKNMSLTGGRVAICDLDNVHLGSPLYDLGYLTGHVVLHHVQHTGRTGHLVRSLLDAYQGSDHWSETEEETVSAVAGATILYRLWDKNVPYRLTLTTCERSAVAEAVWDVLSSPSLGLAELIGRTETSLRR
ncbi:phosphotransferase [Amycolatopsis coloradensis]|uniref:Phosphotransferase n=1 Tax=Amycolatopsis coloradensis TaxID=76021 RepID=A0ACD5BP95_9PSEU